MKIQYTLRIYKHLHRKSNVYDIFDFLQLKKKPIGTGIYLYLRVSLGISNNVLHKCLGYMKIYSLWKILLPSGIQWINQKNQSSNPENQYQYCFAFSGLLVRLVSPCEQLTTYSPGNSCFHQRFEKLCHRVNSAIQSISRS